MTLLTIPLRPHPGYGPRTAFVRLHWPSAVSWCIPNGLSREYNISNDTDACTFRLGPVMVNVIGCWVKGRAPQEPSELTDVERCWMAERTLAENRAYLAECRRRVQEILAKRRMA